MTFKKEARNFRYATHQEAKRRLIRTFFLEGQVLKTTNVVTGSSLPDLVSGVNESIDFEVVNFCFLII